MRTRRSWKNQDRLWRELGGAQQRKRTKRTPLISLAELHERRQAAYLASVIWPWVVA